MAPLRGLLFGPETRAAQELEKWPQGLPEDARRRWTTTDDDERRMATTARGGFPGSTPTQTM